MIFEASRRRATKLARLYQYRNRAWGIIGKSQEIIGGCADSVRRSRRRIRRFCSSESGTGKELCAKAIHDTSDRERPNFVARNIAAINEGLVENKLFGHEKGAFTGANLLKKGIIEEAGGGGCFSMRSGRFPPLSRSNCSVLPEREPTELGAPGRTR